MWKVFMIFILLFKLSFTNYTDTWNSLLKDYTSQGEKEGIVSVLVDYENLMVDSRWNKLLDEVKNHNITSFSKVEAKAFWINVYNIGAVKMVIDNHPLKSIKNAGNLLRPVWDREVIEVANQMYSLGHIEHNILRKTGDSLIHYAIVCASMSCPDLRYESYEPTKLAKQLKEQKAIFIENTNKGLRIDGNTYYVSKLYKWYKDDFGNPYIYINIPQDKKIKYMNYNWSLNSK